MSQPLPTRRRWFRFSLRTMLALVIVVAIPLAWIAKERRQSQYEQSIAELLRAQGVKEITFCGPYDSWELYSHHLPQGWWRDLARRALGDRILIVWRPPREFKDLSPLAGLKNIRLLLASQTRVSDLSPLAGLSSLKALVLNDTDVSDLTPLAGLTKLNSLELRDVRAGREQILALQKAMPNCKVEHNSIR